MIKFISHTPVFSTCIAAFCGIFSASLAHAAIDDFNPTDYVEGAIHAQSGGNG